VPARIERCYMPNPGYQRDGMRELSDWHDAGHDGYELPPEARTTEDYYLPPEARGLPVVTVQNAGRDCDLARSTVCGLRVRQIVKEVFFGGSDEPQPYSIARFTPGIPVFLATFLADDQVLYLREVTECPEPFEAQAHRQSLALEQWVAELLTHASQTESDLAATSEQLDKAQKAAGLTLAEALSKWMRLSVPGRKAETVAKIKEAVARYVADPDSRSLAKVAKDFGVSRKTVSIWFKVFTEATGFLVVRHKHHESAKAHLRAEGEDKRQHGDPGEDEDDKSDE